MLYPRFSKHYKYPYHQYHHQEYYISNLVTIYVVKNHVQFLPGLLIMAHMSQ